MTKAEIEQAALDWFSADSAEMIRIGEISKERIVEYFLKRHPWIHRDEVPEMGDDGN
jgi:hypothetical protein